MNVSAETRTLKCSVIAAITSDDILGYIIVKGSANGECLTVSIIEKNKYPEVLENRKDYVLFWDQSRILYSRLFEAFIPGLVKLTLSEITLIPDQCQGVLLTDGLEIPDRVLDLN